MACVCVSAGISLGSEGNALYPVLLVIAVITIITLPLVGGWGFLFEQFLCLFISLSATLRENGWTDLREIFREGVE